MKLTKDKIKDLCSEKIYQRGERYYNEGRVELLEKLDTELFARVMGSREYQVKIKLDNTINATCDCPYDWGTCKHVIATLLALLENDLEETWQEISIDELKNYLLDMSGNELIDEVINLFERFNSVKEYYSIKINSEQKERIKEKYRRKIKNELSPEAGMPKLRYFKIKDAILEFKKLSDSRVDTIDLILSAVEYGVEFTTRYGDVDEQFYLTIEDYFEEAVDEIWNYELESQFQERCLAILEVTEGMGWGFHDSLTNIYYSYFE